MRNKETNANALAPLVLLIEDEPMLRLTLGDHLRDRGFEILEAGDGETGLRLYREHSPELVTLDLRMEPMDGHEVLSAIRETDWETPVIIISGQGQFDDVVRALRNGACDYLQKPITDLAILDLAVTRALERVALRRGNALLSKAFLADELQRPDDFSDILTVNQRMRDIFRYCEAVARSGEPVLITGETGAGKELLARALHRSSGAAGPFVAVNVAGLDDQTFADTLFGHVRGAYTGADKARGGLMETAQGGSLFLDEVGDLGPQAQVRLLRVLQEREYHPLGSDSPRPLHARILSATNQPLEALRTSPTFRRDFFYRIATHSLAIPPLRSRREDILPLFRHFLGLAAQAQGREVPELSPTLVAALQAYPFPGNVRELKAMAHDSLGHWREGALGLEAIPGLHSPGDHPEEAAPQPSEQAYFTHLPALPTIRTATQALIAEALQRSGGVQKTAAALLGISPQALSERLRRS